jgi:hypothetical protein
MSSDKIKGFLLYLLKSRWPYVAIVALVLILYVISPSRAGDVANKWIRFEPLIGVMTFLTAFAVF